MKAITNLLLGVLLVTGLVFTSCKKDNNEESGGSVPSNGSLTLKHGGQSWSATLSVQAVNTNGVVNITGSDSNANQGAVVVYQASGPGTYTIGPAGNAGNLGRWTEGLGQTDTYVANQVIGSGEVTFTELDATKAKGTFHFEGFNTDQNKVVVTEGSFNVTF